jgi:probable HAF family extracellular repeat protein
MKIAYPSLRVSTRATLTLFIALLVGAIALLSLGTRPAETKETSVQPLYTVQDLGTLPGGSFSYAFGINEAGKVVGAASLNESPEGAEEHPFLYSGGVMSDLGTLGGPYAHAVDINDADKVVGSSTTNAEAIERHAFLYSGGQMEDLGTLGGTSSFATGINEADQVVGAATTSAGAEHHAFLYNSGVMSDLGTLGGPESTALAINNTGKVVGRSETSESEIGNLVEHAFLYDEGATPEMQDLGTFGGSFSFATGINDADKVVGSATLSGDAKQHTFLYNSGVMKDLGTLGGPYSYPLDINNADQVVGISTKRNDPNFTEYPFLYSGGKMRDLNSLISPNSGWVLTNAEDINDNGYIVGKAVHEDGREHAVLMVPPQKGQGPR